MENVRYVQIIRKDPSPWGDHFIQISEISATRSGRNVRIVGGTIHRQYTPDNGLDKLSDGNPNTFACTQNDPDSSITVELESPVIDELVIGNRFDCCRERIKGCQLRVLRSDGSPIRVWPLDIPDNQHHYVFIFDRAHGFNMQVVEQRVEGK